MEFDIVIDTPDHSVDMKSGLDTMQGASEVVRVVTETLLTGRVPSRKSHKSSVRTSLKKSFKGSYGHTFSLDIFDEEQAKKLKKMGSKTFIEVMTYLVEESLYIHERKLSISAQSVINDLGDNFDILLGKLRQSPLKSLHESSNRFNYSAKLRYRESATVQTIVKEVDRGTAAALNTKTNKKKLKIKACITRFNIHTGNGRLLIEGEEETIPFSIAIPYREVKLETKKVFSNNLDTNNGVAPDARVYLDMRARTITAYGGYVVKYIITGF